MTPSFAIPYRIRVMLLLYFLMLITYLDRVSISLVGIRIKAAFQLTNTQFGWVLSAFVLAYALFEIPSGLLGDRLGQRKVLLRIVIFWSLFTALTGTVTSLTSLIFVRFLFGMGEAGAYPNSCGVISNWMPKSETSRGMSWLGMGAPTGAALAPFIVVPIAQAYGWRVPFFVNGFLGLIWVSVCWFWFRNHPAEMRDISSTEKELIEKNRNFVKQSHDFPFRRVLKTPMIWALFFSYFSVQWANYFFSAWMPNYLQEGKHFSEHQMKNTAAFVFSAGIVSALLFGLISDRMVKIRGNRFTRKYIGLILFALMSIAIWSSILATDQLLVTCCFATASFCLVSIVLNCFSVCVDIGGDRVSTLTGMLNFYGQSGAFLMSVIFGKLVDLTQNFETPQVVMLVLLVAGGICWNAIDSARKIITESEFDEKALLA